MILYLTVKMAMKNLARLDVDIVNVHALRL